MKKRYLFITLALIIWIILPWLLKIDSYLEIRNVQQNEEDYIFIDADVEEIKIMKDSYQAVVRYPYKGKIYTEEIGYGVLSDDRNKIPIAVNKATGNITRMKIKWTYLDIVEPFISICLLAIVLIRYKEDKKKMHIRQAKDWNETE